MPKHVREVDIEISQSKSCYGERTHEAGICSTQCVETNKPTALTAVPVIPPVPNLVFNQQLNPINVIPAISPAPNIINNNDESYANLFCFGVFAYRISGIVYNNLTDNFPFMSYNGNVCFLIVYHYKANAILATPIAGLDGLTIFNAYQSMFQDLASKYFKPKLNVMDNHATKYIEKFFTKEECKLQLVEPHNHCVNATERAIQTFKDAFIAALAMTDRDFPL
jgi:hypothetical protein